MSDRPFSDPRPESRTTANGQLQPLNRIKDAPVRRRPPYLGRSRQPGGPMHSHGPHVVTPSLVTQVRVQAHCTTNPFMPPKLPNPGLRSIIAVPPLAMPREKPTPPELLFPQPHPPPSGEWRRISKVAPIHSLQCLHTVASECTSSLHQGQVPPCSAPVSNLMSLRQCLHRRAPSTIDSRQNGHCECLFAISILSFFGTLPNQFELGTLIRSIAHERPLAASQRCPARHQVYA